MQYQISSELESFVEATGRPATLIELLDQRALQQPDQLAYTFLLDGETSELHLTYGELERRARPRDAGNSTNLHRRDKYDLQNGYSRTAVIA